MLYIMKCPKCKEYTLKNICSKDNIKTIRPIPLKYTGKEIIGQLRRKIKSR